MILDILFIATGWIHVLLAPYTKVEESFNLHATHDVLMYGVGHPSTLEYYDHFTFPGAVPRTFTGSVMLGLISMPAAQIANTLGLVSTKFDLQIIVRLVLATVNALGLCLIRRAVSRRFGRPTSLLFVLLSCSQFHIPFWMGRTLPNMFALLPVNLSTYLILDRAPNSGRPSNMNIHLAIGLLTYTAVIFRAEILLLLIPLILEALAFRYLTLYSVIRLVLFCSVTAIAFTVTIDSYFWQKWPLWPEFASIYFNVLEGKSSDWGVSPFHTYFTAYLPKLLLSALPLSFLGMIVDARVRSLLLPSVAFICLISFLGHKEWRFIVYIVPIFNVAAARGAKWMMSRKKSGFFGRILFLVASLMILSNVLLTSLQTYTSIANYPGGQALALLNEKYADSDHVHVHISNLAAQTGASLFLQTHCPPYPPRALLNLKQTSGDWTYNKTEFLSLQTLTADRSITHLITEDRPCAKSLGEWEVVETVPGFVRWNVDWDLIRGQGIEFNGDLLDCARRVLPRVWDVLSMVKEDKLWIMERKKKL